MTFVPRGARSSSIDERPNALTRASMVLSPGSDVPERMSATVPVPRPDATASCRMVMRPRARIKVRVRLATRVLPASRAEFRTPRTSILGGSTTNTQHRWLNRLESTSGLPRGLTQPTGMVKRRTHVRLWRCHGYR